MTVTDLPTPVAQELNAFIDATKLSFGEQLKDALACGACHLMSGSGHPESADLTGLTAAYIIQQMEDFRTGARKDSARMNGIVQGLSDEEIRKAAEWFAGL